VKMLRRMEGGGARIPAGMRLFSRELRRNLRVRFGGMAQ
jgi:hypothetical protein